MPASNLRIIAVPTAERITETTDDCKFSCENKYSTIQGMDQCHLYCDKTDTLFQGSDGGNKSSEISRLP